MNCSNCGREVSPGDNTCPYCDAGQGYTGVRPEATPAKADDLQGVIAGLQAQVDWLQAQMVWQEQRIDALENAGPGLARETPPKEATSQTTGPVEAPAGTAQAPAAPRDAPTAAPPADEKSAASSHDWEWLVGGNWLGRVGILALIIGTGFFLKLAFDNDWIGENLLVFLGLVVGAALLGGGELWARRYPAWAQAITGGGIAILYLSIFAAHGLYFLVPATTALVFSSLVTLVAATLALRYDARAVAVLGILGGFATPLFLADSLPGQWEFLTYVLVLDLGVLSLAVARNWRVFTLLALLGSLMLFGFWFDALNPGLLLAQIGITLIFLIFVGATTLFHLLWHRTPNFLDQCLIVLNGMAYFGISYGILSDEYRAWMGGFTLLLALFYGVLGYGILARYREQMRLIFITLGMALVFLTIAVPVQVDGPWVAILWAAQMVVLVWLSFVLGMRQLRWTALVILALVSFQLIVSYFAPILFHQLISFFITPDWETTFFGDDRSYWPLVNRHFMAPASAIAAIFLSAFVTQRWRGRSASPGDAVFASILLIAGNGLTLFALSAEVIDAMNRGFFAIAPEVAGNVTSLSLSALWALYAAALIVLGIVRSSRLLRLAGLGLLAMPVSKLFLYDAFSLGQAYRVTAFIGLGVLLVVGGFLYQRHGRAIRGFLLE
ncbi:MAG: DUF2339 domain-containing protein [Caldilineaceae bacterium]|nr:DUF2339 domain-containing protein [Caldilineaceae bacterium]MDE0340099.1 DUF2339 domain-containing protein [Caldilineaceae bacterium]